MTDWELVYDRALIVIKDYKLDNLYNKDYDAFLLFMKGLLTTSVDLFNGCLTDLSYHDETLIVERMIEDELVEVEEIHTYFNTDLSSKEISILSMIVVHQWMQREVNDVAQFSNHLSTRDFKNESSYLNLKQKVERLDKLREVYLQEINNYQIDNMDSLFAEYGW